MARYQWIGSMKMEIPERPDAVKPEEAKPQRKKAKAVDEPMPKAKKETPADEAGE